MPMPVRIENFIEPLPIRTGRAEQASECRLEKVRARCRRAGKNRERVPRFCNTGLEPIVAQAADEAGKPTAHPIGHALGSLTDRIGAVRHLRSRYLAEEALVYFTREPRAILMRLKQANH